MKRPRRYESGGAWVFHALADAVAAMDLSQQMAMIAALSSGDWSGVGDDGRQVFADVARELGVK